MLVGKSRRRWDVLSFPTSEYDGAPLSGFEDNGYPILDKEALDFAKVELVGFDGGFRVSETTATFIVMQKTNTSGTIFNTSSMVWCSENGMGGSSGAEIKKITINAIQQLLDGKTLLTE